MRSSHGFSLCSFTFCSVVSWQQSNISKVESFSFLGALTLFGNWTTVKICSVRSALQGFLMKTQNIPMFDFRCFSFSLVQLRRISSLCLSCCCYFKIIFFVWKIRIEIEKKRRIRQLPWYQRKLETDRRRGLSRWEIFGGADIVWIYHLNLWFLQSSVAPWMGEWVSESLAIASRVEMSRRVYKF